MSDLTTRYPIDDLTCSECMAPQPFDSANAASWLDLETREVVAVTCSASCAELRAARLEHAAKLPEIEPLRVRYARAKARTWAENLRHNAGRTGTNPLRASAMLSHAESLEELADILAGGSDTYVRFLEELGNLPR